MDLFYGLKMLNSGGIQKMAEIGILPFFLLLFMSLLTSLFISHLYLRFYGTKGTGSTIHRAFPLLGVAITAIFVSLQFSVPLSLGLLGALSIVRFRTPIKDPEEVGFILLVIAASLSCATFNLPFLAAILVIAVIGLFILKGDKRLFRKNSSEGILILKVPNTVYGQKHNEIINAVKENVQNTKIDSILEENTVSSMTYSFGGFSDQHAATLKTALKAISPDITVNIFFSNTSN